MVEAHHKVCTLVNSWLFSANPPRFHRQPPRLVAKFRGGQKRAPPCAGKRRRSPLLSQLSIREISCRHDCTPHKFHIQFVCYLWSLPHLPLSLPGSNKCTLCCAVLCCSVSLSLKDPGRGTMRAPASRDGRQAMAQGSKKCPLQACHFGASFAWQWALAAGRHWVSES
jgi:hypothetical protein